MKNKSEQLTKVFYVASRSSNTNSFGLRGHIMLAEDGEAWEVGRSDFAGNDWVRGYSVKVPLDQRLVPDFVGCEIPRKLANAPQAVVTELLDQVNKLRDRCARL